MLQAVIRRLSAFLLVLACVLAPALPAAMTVRAHACCCKADCGCDPASASCPQPVQTRAIAPVTALTPAAREQAPRPVPSSARLLYPFVSFVPTATAPSASLASLAGTAASVSLFKAHCSFRI